MNQKITIEIDYELSEKITLENLKQLYESNCESYAALKLRCKNGEKLERYELEEMNDFKEIRKALKRVITYYMDPMQQKDAELRIKKLEAALREIADCCTLPAQNDYGMREIARKALEEKKDD